MFRFWIGLNPTQCSIMQMSALKARPQNTTTQYSLNLPCFHMAKQGRIMVVLWNTTFNFWSPSFNIQPQTHPECISLIIEEGWWYRVVWAHPHLESGWQVWLQLQSREAAVALLAHTCMAEKQRRAAKKQQQQWRWAAAAAAAATSNNNNDDENSSRSSISDDGESPDA